MTLEEPDYWQTLRHIAVKNTALNKRNGAMAIEKSIASSSLAEVVDRILDKGVVIDAFVRVALVGIELLAVEARIVIASVETWLKYADAVGLVSSPMEA
jgi:gas vesicle structural protein